VSLGRPGGNITGLTNISPELAGKRLEWSCPGFVEGELLSRILTAPAPRGIGR
jgi:hypothetical protein